MEQKHMFTNKMIADLLIPVVLEQLLNSIMGTADTMMVSNVGSAAISAVSLVDSINVLVIQAFSALAAGGAIVCAQYIGQKNVKRANESARKVLLIITAISVVISLICLVFQKPMLRLIFGSVEAEVMRASEIYFFYTALSFPFIAAYDSAASIFRAQDNTKGPMLISMISNVMNIAGNAMQIWGFHMGVAGAALATLISRVFCAVVVLAQLRQDRQPIVVRDYLKIRPDFRMIRRILSIGIPSGVENSMFQLGKLAIQSSVSTLGTVAIAAQAMTIIFENVNGMAAVGIGIGLMTVVGLSIGAGRQEEAKYYIVKLAGYAEIAMIISCILVYIAARPVTVLAGMSEESTALCMQMILAITIVKPILWVPSFTPPNGLRAAGDVRFSMITATLTMWLCRVALSIFLMRVVKTGPIGVWYGMFADWGVRGVIFTIRFVRGKWLRFKVI